MIVFRPIFHDPKRLETRRLLSTGAINVTRVGDVKEPLRMTVKNIYNHTECDGNAYTNVSHCIGEGISGNDRGAGWSSGSVGVYDSVSFIQVFCLTASPAQA